MAEAYPITNQNSNQSSTHNSPNRPQPDPTNQQPYPTNHTNQSNQDSPKALKSENMEYEYGGVGVGNMEYGGVGDVVDENMENVYSSSLGDSKFADDTVEMSGNFFSQVRYPCTLYTSPYPLSPVLPVLPVPYTPVAPCSSHVACMPLAPTPVSPCHIQWFNRTHTYTPTPTHIHTHTHTHALPLPQLDSMIAAVKVESSALDSMKEKLREVRSLLE
jgi:hypothetical protein